MIMLNIDRVILGDNQFFGVNHMSQDKGKQTFERFKDPDEIKRILYYALDKDVRGVMFSTHPSIYQICDMMRADKALKENFNVYVNVPYIIKYVSMLNEMGIKNTIKTMLSDRNSAGRLAFMAQTGINVLSLNVNGIIKRLIDVELAPFQGLNVKAVFLHNSLCDLAMAYNMKDVVRVFDKYIRKKYDALPGYGTLNFPQFARYLNDSGLLNSLVMCAFNKIGFLMNPDRTAYEKALRQNNHTVLAMATLASGRLNPDEAYEYLAGIGVENVVVGLSSKTHADETFGIIRKYILKG
jgi:hypothetical protein